jgi:5-methyltetrahydropteroyltriglutamate--homocysteine methyltransferase
MRVAAYQHGTYPRSEDVVAATRGLERGRTSPEEVDEAFQADRADFIQVQKEANLDYFSDGLIRWQDLFRPLVEATTGLDARTLVRWFDNNSFFRAPEVTGALTLTAPLPSVFQGDQDVPAPRVANLPSPYLFSRAAQGHGDRNTLMMELTREILRPVAEALVAHGYELIHLQEPWLPYFGLEPADWDDLEKALMEIRDGISSSSAQLVLHTYFGDVGPYADRLRRLPIDALGVDFVQTDLAELGTGWDTGIMAGVLDGRSSPVESTKGTVEFLRRVVETIAPPTLFVSSNSELEYLPRDIAREKVARLGEISTELKDALV